MKKRLFFISVLFSVLLVSFTGCKGEKEPLRIFVDLEHANLLSNDVDAMLLEFQNTLNQSGGLTDIEFECLPKEGAERESAMNRIRAELMAGHGPDVFVIIGHEDTSFSEPLFLIPEEAMTNDFFLPLDKYIEKNTQFTEWDKLTKPVLEAGCDEEGQQIIPLAYKMPILYLNTSESLPSIPENMTWEEILEDDGLSFGTKMLSDLCTFTSETELSDVGISNDLDFILGDLADYEADKLMFTEEELHQYVHKMLELNQEAHSGAYVDVPVHNESGLTVALQDIKRQLGTDMENPWKMVSLPSVNGGYTALITSYAAVNRNTQRPEDAFTVIDLLLRTHVQQNYRIYNEAFFWGGFPIHEELLQEEYPVGVFDDSVSDAQFKEICEVREKITSAHFTGALGIELQKMLYECVQAAETNKSVDEIVSNAYRTMNRILAE